jgi:HEAT repeat protein
MASVGRDSKWTEDPDPGVRAAAVAALGHLEVLDSRGVDRLISCARDQDDLIAASAHRALIMIGTREPANLGGVLISRCVPGPQQWVDQDALRVLVTSLGEIGVQAILVAAANFPRNDAIVDEVLWFGSEGVQPCLGALTAPKPRTRETAVWALRKRREPQAFKPLIAALNDRDEDVRYEAIWALGDVFGARAVPGLIPALGDSAPRVRLAATRVLGKIGSDDARAALKEMVERGESDANVLGQAALGIGVPGDPHAADLLLALIAHPSDNVRRCAMVGLRGTGDPRAVDAISARLPDPDAYEVLKDATKMDSPLRAAAQEALRQERKRRRSHGRAAQGS